MHVQFQLRPHEARLFGVLIEKSLTTPDQYPLTLTSATNGANQKTNREPVLALSEGEVEHALSGLVEKNLARRAFPENSRVEKYSHRGVETLGLDTGALAVLAELLMRGPQTPGELRARAARMSALESLEALMAALRPLIERSYVKRLPPAPGSRAERYVQLVCPDLHPTEASVGGARAPGLADLVASLEAEVRRLRRQLESLAARLGHPLDE